VPGPNNPSGFILTVVLGIAGSFLATFIGQAIGWYRPDQGAGFVAATVGAVLVLFLYGIGSLRAALFLIPARVHEPDATQQDDLRALVKVKSKKRQALVEMLATALRRKPPRGIYRSIVETRLKEKLHWNVIAFGESAWPD
jgi:uncharacterized membrane protein YeaQ/YmgE (transglycosylase-associated protein family)